MLALSIATVLLIVAGFLVGTLFTQKCHIVLSEEADDNLIANTWVGVTLLAGVLLAISLALPIGGVVLAAALLLVATATYLERNAIRAALPVITPTEALKAGVVLALVLIGVTLNTSRDTSHTDTGLYHLPQMVWMSLTGLVPGLGLLHHRFGYNSTWLALVAPFFDLLGGARLTALGGSLVFSLLILHGLFAALRLLTGTSRACDWYLVFALLPAFSRPILSTMASSSPDLPVFALAIMVGWVLLRSPGMGAAAIACCLAAGAVSIKVSALPLLAAPGLFFLWKIRAEPRRIVPVMIFGVMTLGSAMAANFMTSGCLLFPSAVTCLPVSWAVSPNVAAGITEFISQWPITSFLRPTSAQHIRTLIDGSLPELGWDERATGLLVILRSIGWAGAAAFGCAALLALVACLRLRSAAAWVVGITAVVGLLYTVIAPSFRYAAGWLGMLARLAGVAIGLWVDPIVGKVRRGLRLELGHFVAALAVSSFLLAAFAVLNLVPREGDREQAESGFEGRPTPLAARLLLPPTVVMRQPNPAKGTISGTSLPLTEPSVWVPTRVGDVDFIRPERGEQCWWVKDPCTPPDEPLRLLKFRDPSAGHRAGYELDRRNEPGSDQDHE